MISILEAPFEGQRVRLRLPPQEREEAIYSDLGPVGGRLKVDDGEIVNEIERHRTRRPLVSARRRDLDTQQNEWTDEVAPNASASWM